MTSQFVQLEEFDEPLRGRKICAYLPVSTTIDTITHYIRLIVSNAQVGGGEPFSRIICVTSDHVYRLLADIIGATMIIGAKDNTDLSLILTAASQHPTSTLIVFFPDVFRIPDAFYQRLSQPVTVINIRPADDVTTHPQHGCNVYMMPYVKELGSTEHSYVQKRIAGLGLTQHDLTAILKELRTAHAGLMIVRGTHNELYWWNTAEEVPHIRRRPEVIANLLKFIADCVN